MKGKSKMIQKMYLGKDKPNVRIYVKGCYTLLGKIEANPKAKFRFNVPLKNKPDVVVEIVPGENKVESFDEMTISNRMWDVLKQNKIVDPNELPPKLKDGVSSIGSDMNNATRRVLRFVKYWLRCRELNEQSYSVKGFYWSVDKSGWQTLPLVITTTTDFDYMMPLKEQNLGIIQQYIQDSIEPFLAFRHLHRAKREAIPRYKWIDATIAAELAIKEFFVRFKPELRPLLLEIASPPLHKLYGGVLESYANERSPKLAAIAKGVERRNKLLHRPQEEHISLKEANKYIHDVEIAIYHLLTLLYPKDSFIKRCLTKCKNVSQPLGNSQNT